MTCLRYLAIWLTTPLLVLGCGDDSTTDGGAEEVGTDATSDTSSSSEEGSSSEESSSSESESDSTDSDSTGTDSTGTDSTGTDSTESDSTGTDSTDSEGDTTDDTTTDGTTTDDSTETGLESCEEIEQAYDTLTVTNTGCSEASDCHVVDGHCWMGLGGCWYVVNQDLQQSDLDALADDYEGMACFGAVCLCIQPPDAVDCVDSICQPA